MADDTYHLYTTHEMHVVKLYSDMTANMMNMFESQERTNNNKRKRMTLCNATHNVA